MLDDLLGTTVPLDALPIDTLLENKNNENVLPLIITKPQNNKCPSDDKNNKIMNALQLDTLQLDALTT